MRAMGVFVGDVGDKFLSHLVDLDLLVDVLLELLVGLLELCDGLLELVGEGIHIGTQDADFILLLSRILQVEV